MPQRVEFQPLPNTRPDQLVGKLHAALNVPGGPDGIAFKAYRSHLREQGLWDKQSAATMMSLVDVTWDRAAVTFGPLARTILSATDEEAIQTAIFERLRAVNVLLVKYVFDALDVENGGRLHSDNELYRMITSYVYPGEHITLPAFQAWVHWMAGAGILKIVGIRWALTERAQTYLPEMRGMDVEEILEDLAEEADETAVPATAPAQSAPPPVPAPVAEATPVAEEDEEDDLPVDGMPPEAEPPSEEDIARAEAEFVAEFGEIDLPPERPARPMETPVAALSAPDVAGVIASSADLPLIAEQLVSAWDDGAQWPSYTANQLGIAIDGDRDGAELLVELGTVAMVIEGLAVQPQVFAFVAHLYGSGFFDALRQEGLGAALETLELSMASPAHQALSERLIHSHGLTQRVSAHEDLMGTILASRDAASAIYLIHDSLLGGTGKAACFWVLRELVRAELAPASMANASVVPNARLLGHAHRLGIVPRTELDTLEDLIVASCAVGATFGADSGYGEALEVMDRLMGLATEGL